MVIECTVITVNVDVSIKIIFKNATSTSNLKKKLSILKIKKIIKNKKHN